MSNFDSAGSRVTTVLEGKELSTFIPLRFVRRAGRSVVVPPANHLDVLKEHARLPDTILVEGLARAFYWQRLIDEGVVGSGVEIARQEGLDQATVNESMRLTLIAPEIIESILKGTHPHGLTLQWLSTNTIPCLWDEQQEKFLSIAQRCGEALGATLVRKLNAW
jgi:hypothetical protein